MMTNTSKTAQFGPLILSFATTNLLSGIPVMCKAARA